MLELILGGVLFACCAYTGMGIRAYYRKRKEMFEQKTLLEQKRLVYGNILDTDPVRIWDMLDYRDFRADLAHGATPPTCLTCPKRYEHMF